MECAHPFGSTAADLKAALALSRDTAVYDANAESELAAAVAVSEEEEEFELLFDSIGSVFRQPAIIAYIDGHCNTFEDAEQNKVERTQIHSGYKHLVDELLTAELSDLEVTPMRFQRFCEQCLNGTRQLDDSFKVMLLGTDDFIVFKQMMIKRRSDLHHSLVDLVPSSLRTPSTVPKQVQAMMALDQDIDLSEESYAMPLGTPKANAVCEDYTQLLLEEDARLTAEDKVVLGGPVEHWLNSVRQGMHSPESLHAGPLVINPRPKTLLEHRGSVPADAIAGRFIGSPERVGMGMSKSDMPFARNSFADCMSGDMPVKESANFGVTPEPWLSRPVASCATPSQVDAAAQHTFGEPTLEERQQRAEYWRKQRDILRGKSTDNDVKGIHMATHYNKVDNDAGARLALELSCPADTHKQATPPVDTVAMRQAITRHLRGTFENVGHGCFQLGIE